MPRFHWRSIMLIACLALIGCSQGATTSAPAPKAATERDEYTAWKACEAGVATHLQTSVQAATFSSEALTRIVDAGPQRFIFTGFAKIPIVGGLGKYTYSCTVSRAPSGWNIEAVNTIRE